MNKNHKKKIGSEHKKIVFLVGYIIEQLKKNQEWWEPLWHVVDYSFRAKIHLNMSLDDGLS